MMAVPVTPEGASLRLGKQEDAVADTQSMQRHATGPFEPMRSEQVCGTAATIRSMASLYGIP